MITRIMKDICNGYKENKKKLFPKKKKKKKDFHQVPYLQVSGRSDEN